MTHRFWPAPARRLGIDIGASAIRLLELSRRGQGYRVEAYACEALPSGVMAEHSVADVERLSQILVRLVQRSKTRLAQAVVAVSGASVITRLIEVEAGLSERDLESQIQLEADQYIPYPLDEVALDFAVLGPSKRDASRAQLLLAASRRDEVEALQDSLQMAGLTAQVVDVEVLVLERALTLLPTPLAATQAVVEVSTEGVVVTVLQSGQARFRREQAVVARPVRAIVDPPTDHPTQAWTLAEPGTPLQPEAKPTAAVDVAAITDAIGRALQFFFATAGSAPIECLWLAGSVASLDDLIEPLENSLGVRSALANPCAALGCAPGVSGSRLQADSPALLQACGLALRGFDRGHC